MSSDDATRTRKPDDPDTTRTRKPVDPDLTTTSSDSPRVRNLGPVEVPGYTLHEVIGEGGMGVVYKATHIKLNRTVALKMVVGGRAAASKDIIRFLAEAEAVAAIDHPNVVKVFDTGDAGGHPYLAMEYLPGGSLSEKLKAGLEKSSLDASKSGSSRSKVRKVEHTPMSATAAAELIRKLALAVQAAHDRQIVHRDLKPSNILFDSSGEPRVLDFGLAKKVGGGDLTATQAVMGTAAYMAPEQAKGESKFVGPPADVWALGVMLYECLTGARPFTGSHDIEVIRKVVEEEPSSVRSRVGSLPKDLELIVRKCLAKKPGERYSTAAELADDLRRWQQGEPVSVKAAGVVERTVKWVQRNKLAAGILAASLLAAMVTTTVSIIAFRESQRADVESAQARQYAQQADAATKEAIEHARRADNATQAAFESAQAATADAVRASKAEKLANERAEAVRLQVIETRRLLDDVRMKEAITSFDNNLVAYSRETLEAVAPENRSAAWLLARKYCEGSEFAIYTPTQYVQCVAWSPDGRMLASAGSDKSVRLWDSATGQCLKELKGHESAIFRIVWSPDGRTIASAGDSTVRLWDAATGEPIRVLKDTRSTVFSVAWSPDSQRLASAGSDRTIRIWNAATGASLHELKGHTRDVRAVAWSPNGKMLASAASDNTVRLWNAETGLAEKVLKGHTFPIFSVAWSPDGRTIASGSTDTTVRLWNATNGEARAELKGHNGIVDVAWSPDGCTLAATSESGILRLWNAEGTVCTEFKGHTGPLTSVAWNVDGRKLVTTANDRTIRVWDAAAGQSIKTLSGPASFMRAIAWSPDSLHIASGHSDSAIRFWDCAAGRLERELRGHTSGVNTLAWSPNGDLFASGGFDNTTRLWNPATGETLKTLKGHSAYVDSLCWNPSGRSLATASGDLTMRIWDTAIGQTSIDRMIDSSSQAAKTLTNPKVAASMIAWNRDGHRLAATHGTAVLLWNPNTGRIIRQMQHNSAVKCIAWSPDGHTLATACMDGTVWLWNGDTAKAIRELKGHSGIVQSVSWNRDGRTIASGGEDKTIRLWDTLTGQCVRVLEGHSATVLAVAWSPDGRTLASAGNDKLIRLWETAPAEIYPTLVREKSPAADGVVYLPVGRDFLDVPNALPPEEIARRRWLLAPNPDWHEKKATECVKQQHWFAAAVHLRRLAALEPANADAKARLAAVEAKLQAD